MAPAPSPTPRLAPLAALALAVALIAPEAPAATGYACGDGKPNLAQKRCDCPAGKVESTNAKGISSCVEAPKPFPSARPAPARSGAAASPASRCPDGMVAIPAGTFPLEETKRPMNVAAFCVDVNEVTVSDYSACIAANACARPGTWSSDAAKGSQACNYGRAGRALHPINCVVWEEASAYCSFAHKRLLTDEEWEWLARNGDQASKYPWGSAAPDESRANVCGVECPEHYRGIAPRMPKAMIAGDDGFAESAPVGSFPKGKNRWGVNDLAGNVWEWTSSSDVSPKDGSSMKLMRGGSFLSEDPTVLQSGLRAVERPETRTWQIGMRCARSL